MVIEESPWFKYATDIETSRHVAGVQGKSAEGLLVSVLLE
jgi:hypothetical protein